MSEYKLPKIITVAQQKGGAGKSTLVKTLTNYLALEKNEKILNIDLDYSGFLTMLYKEYKQENLEGNIGEIFKTKKERDFSKVKRVNVHKNIDLICFDPSLPDKEKSLASEEQITFILMRYLIDEIENLQKYNYIIIDTHNDFLLFTKNAIAVSDIVLSPLDPAEEEGFVSTRMDFEMEKFRNSLIEPMSGKSYVNADTYIIGNKIMHNWSDHQDFLNEVKTRDDYLTYIPLKALLAKASRKVITIEEMIGKNKREHEKFYNEYTKAMNKIYNAINKK